MIALEKEPALDLRHCGEANLVVEPADISFEDVGEDCVMIRINIRNEGPHPTGPTLARIESAPLGVFVPWQPFAMFTVPALGPGKSLVMSIKTKRPRPAVLGSFDRLPPRELITALSAPESSGPNRASKWVEIFRRQAAAHRQERERARAQQPAAARLTAFAGQLAPDLWDLMGRAQPNWAGNINVFVRNVPVERHFARALRIHPGRANFAVFMVGGSRANPDAYYFETEGLPSDWKAGLHNKTHSQRLVPASADAPFQQKQWIVAAGNLMIVLGVCPPADCREGNLKIRVTRRSDDKTAVVEFNLDPAAQGPGCFVA